MVQSTTNENATFPSKTALSKAEAILRKIEWRVQNGPIWWPMRTKLFLWTIFLSKVSFTFMFNLNFKTKFKVYFNFFFIWKSVWVLFHFSFLFQSYLESVSVLFPVLKIEFEHVAHQCQHQPCVWSLFRLIIWVQLRT